MIMMIITTLFLPSAKAQQGKEGSGGGYEACAKYIEMAEKIIFELSLTQSFNKAIKLEKLGSNIQKYKRILVTPLKCVPVKKLDREARSYPSEVRTELLWGKWENLTLPQKIRLQVHELAVLAGDELDGQYHFSKELFKILISGSEYFSLRLRAEAVIENNKYITLINPFYTDEKGEVYYYGAMQENEVSFDENMKPEIYNKIGANLICAAIGKKYVSHKKGFREGNVKYAKYNYQIITELKSRYARNNDMLAIIGSVTCTNKTQY